MLAELQNRRTLLLAKFRHDDRMVLEADKEITDTKAALENATKLTGVEQSTDVNPIHQTLEIDLAKQQAELAGLQDRRQALARHEGLRVLGEDNYRLLVYGTMVLFVLGFLPSGIGGLLERLRK